MRYNVYPIYICNKDRPCASKNNPGCVLNGGDCGRTACPAFAKNKDAVDIYNKFFEIFDPIYQEGCDGIIGFEEKEIRNGIQ